MKVRCVLRSFPSDENSGRQREQLKLTRGKEYLVFGITFEAPGFMFSGGTLVEILDNDGKLISAPISLFNVTDSRVSRHWELRVSEFGSVTLWPSLFYREFYISDLANDVPEAIKDLARVQRLIESESAEQIKEKAELQA